MMPVTEHTTGAPAQLPPPLTLPDTSVVSVGKGNVTVTAAASDGPALAMTAV